MTTLSVELPKSRLWLRVADPAWTDPLDPTFTQRTGQRWNLPNSFATLYLNADVLTARRQIDRLCAGTPFSPEDLADDAYVLIAATIASDLRAADAVSSAGLAALSLPSTYPIGTTGNPVQHATCQPVCQSVFDAGMHGLWCRSACTDDGRGRELAWFARTERAAAFWDHALPFGQWRHAHSWTDLGESEQIDPLCAPELFRSPRKRASRRADDTSTA